MFFFSKGKLDADAKNKNNELNEIGNLQKKQY